MNLFSHDITVSRAYNFFIAIILIVIYLSLPTTILAHAAAQESTAPTGQSPAGITTNTPCDHCPCSENQGSDCCDTTFCNCACHAPLSQGVLLKYAPVIASQNFAEPSWSFPQVYRTIFVPPQNLL
jgi:hypothetical protein